MEIRQLKTFWTLASTCSFSQTAELLSYVPSTITMQIKSLEEEPRGEIAGSIRQKGCVNRCWPTVSAVRH